MQICQINPISGLDTFNSASIILRNRRTPKKMVFSAKCIKLNERLSSLHAFVVSRSRGGALPLATSDHIHCIFVVMLEEARRGSILDRLFESPQEK